MSTPYPNHRRPQSLMLDAVLLGLKVLVVAVFLANLKNLPFAWTVRFFYSAVGHLVLRQKILPSKDSLFEPTIYSMFPTSPADLDFNMHKCNSSYFVDLDIARCDLLLTKFKQVINASRKTKRTVFIPLGSVACRFYSEVKPLESVRIESRILCWDDKWIFTISRFIGRGDKLKAVTMARYVFKDGRKTINPHQIISECGFEPDDARCEKGMVYAQSMLAMDHWVDAWTV